MPQETVSVPVLRMEQTAPEVYRLDLGPMEPAPVWRPGQWVSLHLPVGPHPPLVRAYSMAAPPDGSGVLPLLFDRVPDGFGSSYLASLKVGDTVDVAGILGKFVLPDPLETDLLLGARGTGIAPARCMVLALAQRPDPPRVTLVYGAQTRSGLVFHEEFSVLARASSWFHYHPTLLEPEPDWDGATGEEIDTLRAIPEPDGPYTPMLCGVRAFTQPARAFFVEERGFDRRAVKVENYD